MWQRFTLYDLRVIGHYLGMLIMYSALLMAVPLVCAIIFQEWEPMTRYLFSMGIALFSGSLLRFCYTQPAKLNAQQALAVVGLAWVVLGVFCSVPLYLSGHYINYLDAVFDGVSGLTTTGASLIVDLDHLSYADNMFRFMMHLLGGLGLIVVALSLGIFGKRSGSSLYRSEGRNEHVVPNVIHSTRFIAKVTAIVIVTATVVIGLIMTVSGIEPVRAGLQAFWISITAFVTGGFAPMQQSALYYHSLPLEVLLMILMLMGAISFIIYSELWRGRSKAFFRDIETRTAIIWLIVMIVVFTASMAASTMFSDLPMLLRRGTFMVVSSFTTTGLSVITVNQLLTVFTSGAFLTLALIMAVGGGAGSTAGGIKVYRVGMIAKSILSTVKQAVSPDSARVVVSYYHAGRRILSPDVVKEAMTVFILYVITYVIGTLVGIAHGYDASQAIFESVAMTSNGGIITGIAAPGMPPTLELFYILQMWAGRLEFVTLLALVAQVISSVIPRSGGFRFKDASPSGKSSNRNPRKASGALSHISVAVVLVMSLSVLPVLSGCSTQTVSNDQTTHTANQMDGNTSLLQDSSDSSITATDAGVVDTGRTSEGDGSGDDVSQEPDIPADNRINTSQLPDSSFIYDASIVDLENADPYMNGQTVQVIGEVVGDRIASESDPKFCWITLQATGDAYAEVSVYMPVSLSNMIDTYGMYGRVGTKLQVRGVFNLACADHTGLSDLHAENVSLVSQGSVVEAKVNQNHIAWGVILIAGSVVSIFIYRRLRERER